MRIVIIMDAADLAARKKILERDEDDYEKADAKVQGIAKAIWPLVRRKVKSIDYADPTGRLLYTVMGEES